MKVRKAVIPAAGLGTRVLPASKAMPKEMLPIVDKPAIQYIVEEAVASGITDILIITSRGKTTVEDHFDRAPELEARLLASGKQRTYDEIVEKLIKEMTDVGFVELLSEMEKSYKVTSAYNYIEGLVDCLNISEGITDEIPE